MAAPVTKCPCGVCARARLTIQQIFDVLNVYGWLLDSYVVDFFEEQLWEKLPNSWRLALQTVTPDEFADWLTGDISRTHRVWPLSMLALRQAARALQLDRDRQHDQSVLRCGEATRTERTPKDLISGNDDARGHLDLEQHNNHFLKHVKTKKRHEIQQLAQICAACAQDCNAKCIVDVGAGMGHLARSLSFKHGLRVACIEQDPPLSQRAKKWDAELLTSLTKRLPDVLPIQLPRHVSAKLGNSDSDQARTVREMQEIFVNDFKLSEEESEFGIVGLHPCGDLAAMLLRLYVSRRETRFICIVGCCYMKLTLEESAAALIGYPLSRYLSSSVNINRKLSCTALEVACHAIESYCDKLKTGNYKDLIVHAYRAALETILIKYDQRLRHGQVRNVKVTKSMTFEEYCMAATADFEAHVRPKESDIENPQIKLYLSQWQRIIIFGALRTMLAPLVETVVLLDRFLYLSEHNLSPTLRPIFDAKLSPRNFLLFSARKLANCVSDCS